MTRLILNRYFFAILLLAASACPESLSADLVWEDHFVDEDAISTGSSVFADATNLIFTTTVFSDSDGGTFDLAPIRSANFFSFESGTTGNHAGYLEMTFDNENDDPADYLELSIDFQNPVTNLQFSILDLDGSPTSLWDDGVEVFFNGVNIKTDASLYSLGSAIFPDNESYMDGFEAGTTSAAFNQTIGNIDFDFGSLLIDNITIRYLSTDDAVADPASQFIGISDLAFTATAVPEPIGARICLLVICFAFCSRRHNRKS